MSWALVAATVAPKSGNKWNTNRRDGILYAKCLKGISSHVSPRQLQRR